MDENKTRESVESRFTLPAYRLWKAIPPHTQTRLTQNVWCSSCRGVTTIVDYRGQVEGESLILTGRCITCKGEVARLIEEPNAGG